MRRYALQIVLFLLLGALLTIATAWALRKSAGGTDFGSPPSPAALGAMPSSGTAMADSSPDWRWVKASGIGLSTQLPMSVMFDRDVLGVSERVVACSPPAFWHAPSIRICEAGWPARALEGALCRDATGGERLHWSVPLGFFYPLRPIWPGFAINTAFYAGLLWLLFAAPFALRRRRRIKRGLCPKCAYPLGTSDVCTECGATHEVKP